jgi:threonine aldolase
MASAAIDLRSDTLTRPDAAMRRAMATAVVGDDAYGEDPTVRKLEERTASLLGTEAALFVPSGTMGNQIALHLLAPAGSEVICEARSHVVLFELGAMATLSGLLPRTLWARGGVLTPELVESAVLPASSLRARTGVAVLENTHNMAGGTVYDRPAIDAVLAVARRHRFPVHLDGARLWNAALAQGTTPKRLAQGFDTVMVCLSKGLGAPVGSLLAGRAELMAEARRVRRMLGGGMRQAGVLAAAGLVALKQGPGRLAADHENAQSLARAVAQLPGVELEPALVRTNIVVFRVTPAAVGKRSRTLSLAEAYLMRLEQVGVLGSTAGPDEVRLVTHRDVSQRRIAEAIRRLRQLERVPARRLSSSASR